MEIAIIYILGIGLIVAELQIALLMYVTKMMNKNFRVLMKNQRTLDVRIDDFILKLVNQMVDLSEDNDAE